VFGNFTVINFIFLFFLEFYNISFIFRSSKIKLNKNKQKKPMYSFNFLESIGNINLFLTILISCIGLIGNTLTLIIYGQSKYRVNSSNVFILILSIIDSLFLIVHFFEDTIASLKKYDLSIHYYLNVIEINRESCMLINYFRYVLRSISSYVILAFTIQRFIFILVFVILV